MLVAVLGYCGALVSIMHTAALPLLPVLPDELGASLGDVSWVSTSTLLVGAVANPLLGRLGDLYGRRRIILVSLGALVLGSAVAAMSTAITPLVAGRAIQGIGIGVIPLGISVVNDELPPRKVGGAIALISATLGIGAGLGLPLAGIVLDLADWHAVFWVSAALGSVAFVGALFVLPSREGRAEGHFDLLGGLWLSAVLIAFLLPISKAASWGWTGRLSLTSFTLAAVGGIGWVRYALESNAPVVDLRLMRRRPVLMANLAGLALGFAMFSNFFGSIVQLQLPDTVDHGFGLSIVAAGLVMTPGALAMVFMSPVSARLSAGHGPRLSLLIGSLIVGVGYVLRPLLLSNAVSIGFGVVIVNCGVGIAYGALPAVVMNNVPDETTGSANAVNALCRAGGASISSATVGGILSLLTMEVAGDVHPTLGAFKLMFLLSGVASFAAAALAYRIPRHMARHL